ALVLENELWAMAACFFSLPTHFSTEETSSHDSSHYSVCAAAAAVDFFDGGLHRHCRDDLVLLHAGRCIPRSFSAHGRSHHPVARARIGGDRAPGYGSHGSGDEWHPQAGRGALHLSLRP